MSADYDDLLSVFFVAVFHTRSTVPIHGDLLLHWFIFEN